MMVKLNYNYSHCTAATRIKNVASLFASSTLQRWTILLILLYKLDYKDYYCYGSSSTATFNNENGKENLFFRPFFLDIAFWASFLIKYTTHLLKVNILSQQRFATRRASLFFFKREWSILIIFIHSLNSLYYLLGCNISMSIGNEVCIPKRGVLKGNKISLNIQSWISNAFFPNKFQYYQILPHQFLKRCSRHLP